MTQRIRERSVNFALFQWGPFGEEVGDEHGNRYSEDPQGHRLYSVLTFHRSRHDHCDHDAIECSVEAMQGELTECKRQLDIARTLLGIERGA